MTGNVSKVITACAIEDRGTMESPMFPGLLHTTAKSFPIANVYGDAAYAGVRSYALVDALKAQGWFRFSESHTGASGGVFGRVLSGRTPMKTNFRRNSPNEMLLKLRSHRISGCLQAGSDTRRPAYAVRFKRQ